MSKNPTKPGGGGGTQPLVEEAIKRVIDDEELADLTIDAVDVLGVTRFIEGNAGFEDEVYKKLIDCHEYAESSKVNSDMMFIARALPVINGIIHIASNRQRLKEAMDWVAEKWKSEPNPDAISILSALTLIYMAVRGFVKKGDEPEEKAAWRLILRRVRKFTEDTGPSSPPADAPRAG